MNKVYLSLGSNIGNREENLTSACTRLSEFGKIINCSSIYESEAWGFKSDYLFLNMAVVIETILTPEILLKEIHEIEKAIGRVTPSSFHTYESRIIDIDILFYNTLIINSDELNIPHPLLHKRKFVLIPLYEICPDFMHPFSGKKIRELLIECEDNSNIAIKKIEAI